MGPRSLLRRPAAGLVAASAMRGRSTDVASETVALREVKLEQGSAPAPAGNPFLPATTQLREVAKWLIGAFAAVATVMLAGTQLSSLGALSTEEPARLVLAVAAAVVVVAATTGAIYQLSTVLPLDFSGIHGLVRESREQPMRDVLAADSGYRAGRANVAALLADHEAARQRERRARRARSAIELELARAPEPSKELEARLARAEKLEELASTEVKALNTHVTTLVQMKGYLNVRRRFDSARTAVLWLAAVAAAGIITFAWAANPPKAETGAAAALGPRPVEARLVLTPSGVTELAALLGEECTREAMDSGIRVVAMKSDAETSDVVVLDDGPCDQTLRIDVATRLGRLVPDGVVAITDSTS